MNILYESLIVFLKKEKNVRPIKGSKVRYPNITRSNLSPIRKEFKIRKKLLLIPPEKAENSFIKKISLKIVKIKSPSIYTLKMNL